MMTRSMLTIDSDELASTVMELIRHRCDFPHATEESCAGRIAEILGAEGIPARLEEAAPGRPNVYAVLYGRKDGPTIILTGHIDVVPADENTWHRTPFDPVLENGKIYGRGAADMKAGVASCLCAAVALKRAGSPFAGRVILYFNVDEENTNLGMVQFKTDEMNADFAVLAEPTQNVIHIGHRGVLRWRVRTAGTPGHVGWEKTPDNAIEKMAPLIEKLTTYCKQLKGVRHPVLGPASGGTTMISGGSAANIISGMCEIVMDRRLLPGESREGIAGEIHRHLDECGISYELENESWLDASIIPKDHPMVDHLCEAVTSVTGSHDIGIFPATCEAPFFTLRRDIPAVIFGPGSIVQAHVNDEFVRLDEVVSHSRALLQFLAGDLSMNQVPLEGRK